MKKFEEYMYEKDYWLFDKQQNAYFLWDDTGNTIQVNNKNIIGYKLEYLMSDGSMIYLGQECFWSHKNINSLNEHLDFLINRLEEK